MKRTRKSTEERQLEIASAALAIVCERGATHLTTAAIAKEVGLAEGSVFRHFDSKEAIVMAAIKRLDDILLSALPPPSDDPLERLGQFFEARIPIIAANPGIPRVLFTDELGREAGEEGIAAVRDVQARSLEFVQTCLEEAAELGQIRPGLVAKDLVVVVQGAAFALTQVQRGGVELAQLAERSKKVWKTLVKMIGA